MLNYNEIKERRYIIHEDQPYEVISSHVARTQQRKPQNQVKMRNLIDGHMVNATFRQSDKTEEADISRQEAKFLYQKRDEFWFCTPKDPGDRFMLDEDAIDDTAKKFLKENLLVDMLIFHYDGEEKIIGIRLPLKMDFEVTEAPPNIKGDTATGGTKVVTLENGTTVNAPLFINTGDIIRVNTETCEYVSRQSKE
jgi:elongation factor P